MDRDALRDAPFFSELRDEERSAIAPYATMTQVGPGKHLVDEGDYSNEFMVIQEGTAEVRRGDDRVAELGPGDLVGEMGVLERTLRNATVVATTPMRLVALSHWDARRLRKAHPEVIERISRIAQQRTGG